MVSIRSIVSLLAVLPCLLCADVSRVTVNVEKAAIDEPLLVSVTVQHDTNAAIDLNSFLLNGKKLDVELIKTSSLDIPNQSVSVFGFSLPPETQGIHILPSVSFKADGKSYNSAVTSYQVGDAAKPAAAAKNGDAPLKLDAQYEGPETLYPGQKGKFIYRYSFSQNIEIKEEQLPLFETDGFKKIGAKEISDHRGKKTSIRQVTQVIAADKPGTYILGPSKIKGYAYTVGSGGVKRFEKDPIFAEAPPVTVKVKAFPEEGKPPSFNGAVGTGFTFKASLASASQVRVGDKITLLLEIGGREDVADVLPPDLCCQPGFSGKFRFSDLPPAGTMRADQKVYMIEMRPLSAGIKEIPPIEFSYFDPEKQAYRILHSEPIPISVKPVDQTAEKDAFVVPVEEKEESRVVWPATPSTPEPIEIQGNYHLDAGDLNNRFFGTWAVFLLVPFGLAALFLQGYAKKVLERKRKLAEVERSQDVYREALENKDDEARFYRLLTRALLLRLKEAGQIASADITPEELPAHGVAGSVRLFLQTFEAKRFTGRSHISQELINEAHALFKAIKTEEK